GESSARVRDRVEAARAIQAERQGKVNAQLAPREVETFCPTEGEAVALLKQAIARLNLSARAYHPGPKPAAPVPGPPGRAAIRATQMAEAIQYRRLDRGT